MKRSKAKRGLFAREEKSFNKRIKKMDKEMENKKNSGFSRNMDYQEYNGYDRLMDKIKNL